MTADPSLIPGLDAELAAARAQAAAATALRRAEAEAKGPVWAPDLPVARVLVDVPLVHLDKPFDYGVPVDLAEAAQPGTRVKVRFAGQDVDGFVLQRRAHSDYAGKLTPLRRVVSPVPVLSPEIAELSATLSLRYAGTRADLLRLAIPPRHATTEKAVLARAAAAEPAPPGKSAQLEQPTAPTPPGPGQRAVWQPNPGTAWWAVLAGWAASVPHGVLIVVPDATALKQLSAACRAALGRDGFAVLSADSGPSARYRNFLLVQRGERRVVIGTRGAAFAPVADLGLIVIWDDAADTYAEPRAPYPHTREVLLTRASQQGCGMVLAGFHRSVEAQLLVESGWAQSWAPSPQERAAARPLVRVAGDEFEQARDPFARSRVSSLAIRELRTALDHGPVLVLVPRSGYATSLNCARCREPARCSHCQGPLQQPRRDQPVRCRWCQTAYPQWACPTCGHRGLRAPVVGAGRVVEELGRAFPGVPVVSSTAEKLLEGAPVKPAIVVCTPGAQPPGEYSGGLFMDTWLLTARADLRAEEEAARRLFNAAALVRAGGTIVVQGDQQEPAIAALVRWDPAGFAARELEQRRATHLPPASRVALLTGEESAVEAVIEALELPSVAESFGPMPVSGTAEAAPSASAEPEVQWVLRLPRSLSAALAQKLREVQGVRSARKLPHVRIKIDPIDLG